MTISINKLDANNFDVLIKGDKETNHRVHMSEQYYHDLSDGNVPQETVILESFKFLLEREPNTSILSEFDITVIKRFFPEYEKEIKQRLIQALLHDSQTKPVPEVFPYGQKTHPALWHLKNLQFFNGDEFIEGTAERHLSNQPSPNRSRLFNLTFMKSFLGNSFVWHLLTSPDLGLHLS